MNIFKDAPKIAPAKRRLFVHAYPPPEETETSGGIIITRRARESEIETGIRAQIIKAGKLCDPDFKPGVWVLIPRFTGTAIVHDNSGDPMLNYMIIIEDCVMCILDEEFATAQLGLATRQRKKAV
jgi:co-chaperonin GroES (HSP10)